MSERDEGAALEHYLRTMYGAEIYADLERLAALDGSAQESAIDEMIKRAIRDGWLEEITEGPDKGKQRITQRGYEKQLELMKQPQRGDS